MERRRPRLYPAICPARVGQPVPGVRRAPLVPRTVTSRTGRTRGAIRRRKIGRTRPLRLARRNIYTNPASDRVEHFHDCVRCINCANREAATVTEPLHHELARLRSHLPRRLPRVVPTPVREDRRGGGQEGDCGSRRIADSPLLLLHEGDRGSRGGQLPGASLGGLLEALLDALCLLLLSRSVQPRSLDSRSIRACKISPSDLCATSRRKRRCTASSSG